MSPPSRGRVLMILENEGVPSDRRVWDEARTISEAGWDVVIVCPEAEAGGEPEAEQLDGIAIRRFPLRPAAGSLGYLREYLQALARIRRLARRAEREGRFDIVHVANPPDFLGLAAAGARARGARLIFDHHDLVPELFETRYGRRGPIHRLLLGLERRALRTADAVIATNDSYRRIAIERGGVAPDDVFVVRNGPDLSRFRPVPAEDSLRRGKQHLIVYLGVMGPQDGIDWALEALAELREIRGDDWHAAFLGDGEVVEEMGSLAADLGLGDLVEFVGWSDDDDIRRYLSTAAVCLAPDPPGPLNDVSTMAKIPEYMAIGAAIASFDLPESRVSAGDAAAYADSAEPRALGRCVDELLDDPQRRQRIGAAARRRVTALSWERSAASLLDAYERVSRSPARRSRELSGGVAIGGPADGASEQLR